jgi:hypothetical protein
VPNFIDRGAPVHASNVSLAVATLSLASARPFRFVWRTRKSGVFCDVSGMTVEVLAIVAKSEAESWLAQFGNLE